MLRNFYLAVTAFTIILSGILALLALPSHDDLYFIHDVFEKGIVESVAHQYFNYSGRFIAFTINNTILYFDSNIISSIAIIFIHLLFVYAVYLVLLSLTNLEKKHRYLLSLILYLFFLTATQFATETAYWQTQTITYLLPLSLYLLCIHFLIKNKLRKIDYFIFATCLFIASGCSEWISMIALIFLLFLVIKKNNISLINKTLMFFILGLSITELFIVSSAPGNEIRNSILFNEANNSFLKANAVAIYILVKNYLNTRGILFILFAFYLSVFLINKTHFKPKLFLTSGILLFLIGFFPLVYLFKDYPPIRTLCFAECGILLVFICVFSYLNKIFLIYYKTAGQILIVLAILYLGYTTHKAYIYHTAYNDQKNAAIISSSNPFEMEKLPDCDLYHEADVTPDVNNFKNKHIKMGWKLRNNVILKQKSQNE